MFKHNRFEVNYLYHSEPRSQIIEADDAEHYSHGRAARYLVELHCAQTGQSIEALMPEPDADEESLLEQAKAFGISDIRVTRLVHENKSDKVPGHYQQP